MITLYASGTLSTTGSSTEDFLSSPNVQGKFKLVLDLNDMVSGDVIQVKVYKMVLTGGTQRVCGVYQYSGAQPATNLVVFPLDDMGIGEIWNDLTDTNAVRFSITQTFGTAGISIPWAVLKDDALTPTTTARTLDVTSTGEAGLDFGNVSGTITNAMVADDVDVNVKTISANAITAAAIATGAIDADALAADAVAKIWDKLLGTGGFVTLKAWQGLALAAAGTGGRTSGLAGTSGVVRDVDNTVDLCAATIDADGNRAPITITYP